MIGSIGAESRYSTGYNNLKPNRNQNKWADTLAQTVDKEDISSRADINRAKKSTVMDSYLALSGKTINTLKQEYSEYESENYRIVPDNEAECFDIYNTINCDVVNRPFFVVKQSENAFQTVAVLLKYCLQATYFHRYLCKKSTTYFCNFCNLQNT